MIRPQDCPICHKLAVALENANFPFCSRRCREVDLLRWSNGSYAIVRDLDPQEAALAELLEEGELPPEPID